MAGRAGLLVGSKAVQASYRSMRVRYSGTCDLAGSSGRFPSRMSCATL